MTCPTCGKAMLSERPHAHPAPVDSKRVTREGLLERIRRETREAVEEGDAQDCSSPDCIADAVYEIVRVALSIRDESDALDASSPASEPAGLADYRNAQWHLDAAEPAASGDAALREALDAADKAVDDLCSGRLRWEMRVPAEPDHDPDLIISHALGLARAALASSPASEPEGLDVTRLARTRDALAQALPGLVAAWDNDQTDNVGLAEVILRLIAAEYDRLARP